MPIALSRTVKLDIPAVARFVEVHDGAQSAQLLHGLQETFAGKRRAAQDALTILVRGGWLERREDQQDARRKRYFLTQQGRHDLRTASGQRKMRHARWRYSTTSTRARKRRGRAHHDAVAHTLLDALKAGRSIWPGLSAQAGTSRREA